MPKQTLHSLVGIKYIDHSSIDNYEAAAYLRDLHNALNLKLPNIEKELSKVDFYESEDEEFATLAAMFFNDVNGKNVEIKLTTIDSFINTLEALGYEKADSASIEITFDDENVFGLRMSEDEKGYLIKY